MIRNKIIYSKVIFMIEDTIIEKSLPYKFHM